MWLWTLLLLEYIFHNRECTISTKRCQVFRCLPKTPQDVRKPPTVRWGVFKKIRRRPTLPGGDLQVPSAQVGLTAVFEMGTGVTPPPKPPETYAYVTLVTGSLILKRFIASTNIYNSKPSAD